MAEPIIKNIAGDAPAPLPGGKKNKLKHRLPAVMPCTCKHVDQDRIYGSQLRLHNYARAKDIFRCTVCKYEKRAS